VCCCFYYLLIFAKLYVVYDCLSKPYISVGLKPTLIYCSDILFLFQKYCALLKFCLAGTASDSFRSNTSNQGFVFIK